VSDCFDYQCLKERNIYCSKKWCCRATEPDSTHPGYDERIKELAAFYAKLEKDPPSKVRPTLGHFTYSPADNLLSFVPSKP
jgi:hypothetical protein